MGSPMITEDRTSDLEMMRARLICVHNILREIRMHLDGHKCLLPGTVTHEHIIQVMQPATDFELLGLPDRQAIIQGGAPR